MHIAFHYPGLNLGGQQTYMLGLMSELAEMGHRVSWIYHRGDALLDPVCSIGTAHRIRMPAFNAGRFGIQRVANRWFYRWWGHRALRAYCRREGVDVLVSANTPDQIVGSRLAATTGVHHVRLVGGSLRQVEPHWLEVYQARRLDDDVAGYFAWPAVFDELASVGVDREKCVRLPMAVDVRMHFPLPQERRAGQRASLGIPADAFVIGWVGRIARNMQVWNTVALARRLRERGFGDFWLLMVGGGDALDGLREEIRVSGLEDQSVITGWRPYEEMNGLTNAMDVVPLLEADPHGGSIVREAMAAGRVALSVRGPSRVQEEFMKRDCAVLVPSEGFLEHAAAAVEALAGDRPRLERMGMAAAAFAREQMSFRRVAEVFVAGLGRLE